MRRGQVGRWDWKKSCYKRFWGYCTSAVCAHRGRFVSLLRNKRRCPNCKGDQVEEEAMASLNAKCLNDSCWMSEKQEDKSQGYFPGADARCHSCHAQVFWISRANGPEGPPGLFNADGRLGAGSVVTAYCSRAIADADDRECISGGQLIFSFLAGIGPSRRLAPDFTSNVDWFLGGAPK